MEHMNISGHLALRNYENHLSLLPGHNIDSDRAIWLLGLAVVLLAISRIAEMGNKTGS